MIEWSIRWWNNVSGHGPCESKTGKHAGKAWIDANRLKDLENGQQATPSLKPLPGSLTPFPLFLVSFLLSLFFTEDEWAGSKQASKQASRTRKLKWLQKILNECFAKEFLAVWRPLCCRRFLLYPFAGSRFCTVRILLLFFPFSFFI